MREVSADQFYGAINSCLHVIVDNAYYSTGGNLIGWVVNDKYYLIK